MVQVQRLPEKEKVAQLLAVLGKVGVELVAFCVIVYSAAMAVFWIVYAKDILTLAPLARNFAPHAYPILIWTGFFFGFYKKFGWQSGFVFLIANGINGCVFDFTYVIYHASYLAKHPTAWPIDANYPFKLAFETILLILGLIVMRPSFKITRRSLVPLAIFIAAYVYIFAIGFPVTLYPPSNYYNPILNLFDLTVLVSLPTFLYLSILKPLDAKSYLRRIFFPRLRLARALEPYHAEKHLHPEIHDSGHEH